MAEHLHNLHFSEDLLEVFFIQLSLINDLDGNLAEAGKTDREGTEGLPVQKQNAIATNPKLDLSQPGQMGGGRYQAALHQESGRWPA